MQYTAKIIPQWKKARMGETDSYLSPSTITVRAVSSTASANISDGSDETRNIVDSSHKGYYYPIAKAVLADHIASVLPNNARKIEIKFIARAFTKGSASGHIRVLNSETLITHATYPCVSLGGTRPSAQLNNYIVKTISVQNKSGVFDYFNNLEYEDVVLQQTFAGADSSEGIGTWLYDAWLEITYSLPQVKIKAEGEWADGEIKAKVNGEWVDAESVHVKVDGAWIEVN